LLAGLTADHNSVAKAVWRVWIVRATIDSDPVDAICRTTDGSKPCVWSRQQLITKAGGDGPLRDKTRPLERKQPDSGTKAKVLAKAAREAPPDEKHWSVHPRAEAISIRRTSVQRMWIPPLPQHQAKPFI
jgi:hypothetical protein